MIISDALSAFVDYIAGTFKVNGEYIAGTYFSSDDVLTYQAETSTLIFFEIGLSGIAFLAKRLQKKK